MTKYPINGNTNVDPLSNDPSPKVSKGTSVASHSPNLIHYQTFEKCCCRAPILQVTVYILSYQSNSCLIITSQTHVISLSHAVYPHRCPGTALACDFSASGAPKSGVSSRKSQDLKYEMLRVKVFLSADHIEANLMYPSSEPESKPYFQ